MMNNSTIHIAYCTDSNYLEHVATSMSSVLLNNLNEQIIFHLFVYDVSNDDICKIKTLPANIQIHPVEQTEIEQYADNCSIQHLNRSIYIRLLVPRVLADITKRFIYLDADTLCFANLSSIKEIDITHYPCAVSRDRPVTEQDRNYLRLNLQGEFYFNSGFLYINTEKWQEQKIEEQVNSLLMATQSEFIYPDQDALNIVLDGKFLPIDPGWNYLFTWYNEDEKENFFYNKATLPQIIHFTGSKKPWFIEHVGLAQSLYLFYRHFTPWSAIPIKSYQSKMRINDYRHYAKFNLRRKKYLLSIRYFMQYLLLKIKKTLKK